MPPLEVEACPNTPFTARPQEKTKSAKLQGSAVHGRDAFGTNLKTQVDRRREFMCLEYASRSGGSKET